MWKVIGADRDSGADVQVELDAEDEESARRAASERGVFVAELYRLDPVRVVATRRDPADGVDGPGVAPAAENPTQAMRSHTPAADAHPPELGVVAHGADTPPAIPAASRRAIKVHRPTKVLLPRALTEALSHPPPGPGVNRRLRPNSTPTTHLLQPSPPRRQPFSCSNSTRPRANTALRAAALLASFLAGIAGGVLLLHSIGGAVPPVAGVGTASASAYPPAGGASADARITEADAARPAFDGVAAGLRHSAAADAPVARLGPAEVVLLSATVRRPGPATGPGPRTPPDGRSRLVLALRVRNISELSTLRYRCWSASDLPDGVQRARLVDDGGYRYSLLPPELGQPAAAATVELAPDDAAYDVVEFDGPAPGFQYLELELPTANVGSRSIFPIRLRIPAAAVRQ